MGTGAKKKKEKNSASVSTKQNRIRYFFLSVLVSAIHVVVNLLLVGTRTSIVLATVTGGSDAHLATLEVNDGNTLGGELATLDSGQADVSTVVVVLGQDVGGPGPNEQALVLGSARGHVLGDSHGPLVVGVGARLGVATDKTEGLSAVIRQGKLALFCLGRQEGRQGKEKR